MAEPTPAPGAGDHSVMGLAARWWRHLNKLLDHRHITPLPAARVAEHALGALHAGRELVDAVTAGRWVLVAEALAAGASRAQVAAAMGLDADELVAGLRSWARGQLRYGLIDADRHAAVLALLDDQPGGGGSDD